MIMLDQLLLQCRVVARNDGGEEVVTPAANSATLHAGASRLRVGNARDGPEWLGVHQRSRYRTAGRTCACRSPSARDTRASPEGRWAAWPWWPSGPPEMIQGIPRETDSRLPQSVPGRYFWHGLIRVADIEAHGVAPRDRNVAEPLRGDG